MGSPETSGEAEWNMSQIKEDPDPSHAFLCTTEFSRLCCAEPRVPSSSLTYLSALHKSSCSQTLCPTCCLNLPQTQLQAKGRSRSRTFWQCEERIIHKPRTWEARFQFPALLQTSPGTMGKSLSLSVGSVPTYVQWGSQHCPAS